MSVPASIPHPLLAAIASAGPLDVTAPAPTVDFDVSASTDGAVAATAPTPSFVFAGASAADGLLSLTAPSPAILIASDEEPYQYPTYSIEVDWNNDGDWSDGNEDVTDDIRGLAGVAVQYGRDTSQPLAPTASGTAEMELENDSGKYNPANEASPLFGLLVPGRPVRMRATIGEQTLSLFYGHTDDSPIEPDDGDNSVRLSMLDSLGKLRGQSVTTELYQGVRTGAAIHHILDAAGWPEDARDIDLGATIAPWWWVADENAYDAIVALVESEGPPALLSVGPDGSIVFRDRHHRLTRDASMIPQSIWQGRELAEGSKVRLSWAGVINHVEFEVSERAQDAELSQVWQSDEITSLSDGETKTIKVKASDPFRGAVTPVNGVDYHMISGAVTVVLNRTAGQVVDINVTAVAGPATVYSMALRAFSVPVVRERVVKMEDPASVSVYGRRSWPAQAPFAGFYDAQAQAAIILAARANSSPTLTARFVSVNASEMARQIVRDLSDRIEITDEPTLQGEWLIDSIAHRFDGRVGHETTLMCDQVPRQIESVFILGSSAEGVVGTNKLGRMALDEPRNVFIIGSATNAVLSQNLLGY